MGGKNLFSLYITVVNISMTIHQTNKFVVYYEYLMFNLTL